LKKSSKKLLEVRDWGAATDGLEIGGVVAEYFGILDGDDDVWGVRVPDLPGVNGGGSTPGHARQNSISAAREWAEHRIDKGHALPAPSSLGDIVRAHVQANEVIVTIPVLVDSGRPARANLSLDAALLADIDRAAAERGLTRSAFIASAVRDKIFSQA
jgi:predicted RNase H-like HicB family nuclease